MAAATRSGTVSCREVAISAVARLREMNPRLNAVTLDLGDTAVTAAERLDARRRAGEATGPLFGVPITIKDNVEVRGQRTPNGVAGLAHLIAREDAPIVRRLLDAGAVIVGRTNTPEFSMRATTNNALYGLTLNPWDARISCGGSSGGAAAAVATGMCAVGHGNDIAGSNPLPGAALRRGRLQADDAARSAAGVRAGAARALHQRHPDRVGRHVAAAAR